MARAFKDLNEQEVLALAISLEEEDARIYDDFAEGLKDAYPSVSQQFRDLRVEEDGHRHRLLELYRQKFGEHIPLIRRHDVKGFVTRKPVWLVRPLGLSAVRKEAELMELETRRFYERAARQGKHGAELRDAQREAQRHQAPEHPHEGDGAHRARRFCNDRGGAKDTAPDDEPDHHGEGGHERQTPRQLRRPSGRPGGAKEAAGFRW